MSHRSIGSDATSGHTQASQPAQRLSASDAAGKPARFTVRNTVLTAMNATQHTLTVFGVSSIAIVALLYARPEVASNVSGLLKPQAAVRIDASSTVMTATMASTAAEGSAVATAAAVAQGSAVHAKFDQGDLSRIGTHRQQQAVTSWLSKRYRVAGDAANLLVSTAYVTAKDIKLDPLLILAVMAIESGLNPFAESPVGAKGLMQVMADIHHAKFQAMGGPQTALNPVANIRVGSAILKDYVTRGGSVEAGLKTYVGAGAFDTDAGYGSRVLAEYKKLQQVASGKSVPTFTPHTATQVIAEKISPKRDAAEEAVAAPAAPQEAIAGL
jgi:soluble lytic murein transglycosylase-like protein